VHLAVSATTIAVVLTLVSAILATLWSAEVTGSVELLLTFCEGKRSAAIAAGDLLIGHTNERKKINCSFLLSER